MCKVRRGRAASPAVGWQLLLAPPAAGKLVVDFVSVAPEFGASVPEPGGPLSNSLAAASLAMAAARRLRKARNPLAAGCIGHRKRAGKVLGPGNGPKLKQSDALQRNGATSGRSP
ncbi:hypothetical protein OJF2_14290 [Aquisphaera giovannonii]|uniref:Uncharacterized protein n=1 Tax=Aquisphaera giovannonii TaxID=406548 RepID=A0A5B9VXT3_9BACT|nr:hypothetical protein [Aquisphaera giovannonii]QEH32939.1 hypothetical protein OJF2_14290 [Aquisphaera giovannonii]